MGTRLCGARRLGVSRRDSDSFSFSFSGSGGAEVDRLAAGAVRCRVSRVEVHLLCGQRQTGAVAVVLC